MAEPSRELVTLRLAAKAVVKRVSMLRDKKLNENLGYACGSYADAYRIGAEEMQAELLGRIYELIARQQRADDKSAQPSGDEQA